MLTTQKILDLANEKGVIKTSDFVDTFDISRQYVSKLISKLVDEKKLIKIGSTRSAIYTTEKYLQKNPKLAPISYSKILTNKNLEEHRIFNDIEYNFLHFSKLSENIKSIFEYAFSEMFNNAIEHSESKKIKFNVGLNKTTLFFKVDDYGFDKTEIRVRLYTMGGVHISRSQARRVLSGLEKFKIIIMDYDRVPTIGQAFADEIYRVFKNKKPSIEIQNTNMNEAVRFMVERSQNEALKKFKEEGM